MKALLLGLFLLTNFYPAKVLGQDSMESSYEDTGSIETVVEADPYVEPAYEEPVYEEPVAEEVVEEVAEEVIKEEPMVEEETISAEELAEQSVDTSLDEQAEQAKQAKIAEELAKASAEEKKEEIKEETTETEEMAGKADLEQDDLSSEEIDTLNEEKIAKKEENKEQDDDFDYGFNDVEGSETIASNEAVGEELSENKIDSKSNRTISGEQLVQNGDSRISGKETASPFSYNDLINQNRAINNLNSNFGNADIAAQYGQQSARIGLGENQFNAGINQLGFSNQYQNRPRFFNFGAPSYINQPANDFNSNFNTTGSI